MTISPIPPSLDMTATCASGVVPITQLPVVTTVPAMSTATATSREVDVHPGPSRVRPHPRLGLASTLVGEGVPAVVLPFTPRSVPPILVPRGMVGQPSPVCSPGLSHSVFFDVVRPVGHSFISDDGLGGCE